MKYIFDKFVRVTYRFLLYVTIFQRQAVYSINEYSLHSRCFLSEPKDNKLQVRGSSLVVPDYFSLGLFPQTTHLFYIAIGPDKSLVVSL
jgi:hypothetical protein